MVADSASPTGFRAETGSRESRGRRNGSPTSLPGSRPLALPTDIHMPRGSMPVFTRRMRLPSGECVIRKDCCSPTRGAQSVTIRLTRPAATSSAELIRSSQITWLFVSFRESPNRLFAASERRNASTCRTSRNLIDGSCASSAAQRVPRSMLLTTARLRRCQLSRPLAVPRPDPPASVRRAGSLGLAERSDWIGLTPWAMRRVRSASLSTRAGRVPGRNSSSSSGPACHSGLCCSMRHSAAATAPQLEKRS